MRLSYSQQALVRGCRQPALASVLQQPRQMPSRAHAILPDIGCATSQSCAQNSHTVPQSVKKLYNSNGTGERILSLPPFCSRASFQLAPVPPTLRVGAGLAVPVGFGKLEVCRDERKPEAYATTWRQRCLSPRKPPGSPSCKPAARTRSSAGSLMSPALADPAMSRRAQPCGPIREQPR